MSDSQSTQCTGGQPSALSQSISISSPLSCHQPTSDDPHSSCRDQLQQQQHQQQPASPLSVHTLSTSTPQPTSPPSPSPAVSLPPPLILTPTSFRRLRGFSPIDRVAHHSYVQLLKRSPSSLSTSIWKPRVALLAFGCLRLYHVTSAPLLSCPSQPQLRETDGLSLNYCFVDVVGYDSTTSLYIIRFLPTVSFKQSLVIPHRRWYVLGLHTAADCKALVNACNDAVAHSLSIHYTGDGGKVRLREPVEPVVPEVRSVLGWKARGWRGEINMQPVYEDEGDKMVERKVGERGNETDSEDIAPSAYLVNFSSSSTSEGLSLLLTPPSLLSLYDLPPATFINPLLDRLYRNKVGFGCLTPLDRALEASAHSSLLFGEVLPAGVTKLLDEVHLNAREGNGGGEEGGVSVVDMGSGVGKLCVQLLLQYEWVTRIDGFELAISRYKLGKQALLELVDDGWGEGGGGAEGESRSQSHVPFHLVHSSPTSTTVASPPLTIQATTTFPTSLALASRSLTLSRANLFSPTAVRAACTADIVIIETLITPDCLCLLARLLESLRVGCRVLTFHDVRPLWSTDADNLHTYHEANAKRRAEQEATEPGAAEAGEEVLEAVDELPPLRYGECPLVQLMSNMSKLDRFMTSWSQRRGHYFFLYHKRV